MSSFPTLQYQINTDDKPLLVNLLHQEGYALQSTPSTYSKTNVNHRVIIEISQSCDSPSIICCCTTISQSLPRLLSCLKSTTPTAIPLVLLVEPSDEIDWNPLMNLISAYNLSLNVVQDKNDLPLKLMSIIQSAVTHLMQRKTISMSQIANNSRPAIQVDMLSPFIFRYVFVRAMMIIHAKKRLSFQYIRRSPHRFSQSRRPFDRSKP